MRKGLKPDIIINGAEIIGITLGADFCAEHEWGIESLKQTLGIKLSIKDKNSLGLASRKITRFDKNMFFFETRGKYSCLTFEPRYADARKLGWNNYELNQTPEKIAAAWDADSFGLVVEDRYKEFLRDLYEAFQKKDVALWLGGGGAFTNPGLLIFIASRIPREMSEQMYQSDLSQYRLEEEVVKTNIRQILKEAGKKYFALSPRWKRGSDEKEIEFWLNPEDQKADNYGWFTLENLLEWAKNKGPIPKEAPQISQAPN